MNYPRLSLTLAESFSALADEVQLLIDRKTILEHKLRFAHEQYQILADKYATGAPEVAETLAKLQLPPELKHHISDLSSTVPLPKRDQPGNAQHQLALLIREGRKAAQQLTAGIAGAIEGGDSSKATSFSPPTEDSTVLEQDFTVEGRKGLLACPFSPAPEGAASHGLEEGKNSLGLTGTTADPRPHESSDPICATMLDESASAPTGPSKCPIRYLDQHSPEEIARYVETHKHEIPRSHEVCVARYQKSEEQIRKLDAKYGNMARMINDLSQLHRPMLPKTEEVPAEVDKLSNERVRSWVQAVSSSDPEEAPDVTADDEGERKNHFDRPLRDVRFGESPGKPWGLQVPHNLVRQADAEELPPPLSPMAPGRMDQPPPPAQHISTPEPRTCPFSAVPKRDELFSEGSPQRQGRRFMPDEPQPTVKDREQPQPQPTFVTLADLPAQNAEGGTAPQIVFNISGPVFLGYPMEQAIEFMQRLQSK
ncbi:hypothetical protein OQA88_3884 [Cercophora sp. LCS_1]